ncbi:MAG: hypothetical protein NT038_06385 [Euryarchaeota archaeon]|nr:hypothetical protein [Euryarchaeota archaeon]
MSNFALICSFIASKLHEKKTREGMLRLREKKFRKILKYAYNHSKFYHEFYTLKGITEKELDTIKIQDLPVVNKELIMDHFDEVLTTNDISKKDVVYFLDKSKNPDDLLYNKYHVIHSSGSSGKIGIFVYSTRDWDCFFPYSTKTFDFRFSKNKSVFFGAADGHYAGASFSSWTNHGITSWFCDQLILDIKKPIEEHIKLLNRFQPDVLGGYFTGLKILSEKQEQGELHINPRFLVNAGEGIIPEEKKKVERVFHLPMANLYGVAECVIMGIGREEYGGIYLFDDLAYVEIFDDHILLTNLFNKTQPLIRYRINDYLKVKEDTKKMLPYTLVESVIGRDEMVIWLENRKGKLDFIHPIVIAEFYVKGLDKLQIVVKDKRSFEFFAVIDKSEKQGEVVQKIKEKLDDLLKAKDFTDVTYSVRVVDELTIDKKTGKFKLIISAS